MRQHLCLLAAIFSLGCSGGPTGDYTGDLTESRTLNMMEGGRLTALGGGAATSGVTMAVRESGDDFEVELDGCRVTITESGSTSWRVTPEQTCTRTIDGHEVQLSLVGSLSKTDNGVHFELLGSSNGQITGGVSWTFTGRSDE